VDTEKYDLVVLGSGTGSKVAAWTTAEQGKRVAPQGPGRVDGDRILGFAGFAVDAGEIMGPVQMAMIAGLPYTALREAILTHPTLVEGLNFLFAAEPAAGTQPVRKIA
jgi:pyruvate/2-oxoglutarate dehydrogenase complex dihydrolipoamide dehydrogenase (E3) component